MNETTQRISHPSEYNCPLCKAPMTVTPGTDMDPNDGVTVWCKEAACPAHENVFGHGNNEKRAYEIAVLKFGPRRNHDKSTEE